MVFSQSLATLRHFPSQAKVRSTTHLHVKPRTLVPYRSACVGHDMALAGLDPFVGVIAGKRGVFGYFHALAVNHARRGLAQAAFCDPSHCHQFPGGFGYIGFIRQTI